MLDKKGVLFWPVGTGDSTTFVVEPDRLIFQVDLRQTVKSEDEDTDCAPIVDKLLEHLPKDGDRPYLSAFALTHPDKDHVLGFQQLLDSADIGELWFSPWIFRENDGDGLCEDAIVFRTEAHRRVDATIAAGGDPGAGDRVRLIGHDPLLEEEHYQGFPRQFLTIPGNSVTMLDGVDYPDDFKVFIHGPFKPEDMVGDRNNTSLVMQVVLGGDPAAGGVLLFGDHKYPTIRKIIDVTRAHDNEDFLRWQVLLAPHHCSKSVMYQEEGGKTVLKQDMLDDLEALQVGDGIIVASSASVPASNAAGDNPPHASAKSRYEEIAKGGFLCTHDDGGHAEPLRFELSDAGLTFDGALAEEAGISALAAAVAEARGSEATPADKVGFGA
ncbi:hypothetical protein ASG11_04435 [Sphingomonas sp. Leaf357]|uniref:hypothetical protein n=1 Tax=Sphingomonas sp. Leaf357 TaxID=1736350 RepID=UPI0007013B24|nr:hypothetical protein [Sphingomonas sp. Leaf357]KQS03590.1 hypothetical protein ASG11_04435 [Sphingomonas sp. Leaf357]